VKGVSSLGATQFAERWNKWTCPACFTISGTNWTALAALPMTPTVSPEKS
jgi:hypothetical protein